MQMFTVDTFTDKLFQGNPAAVCLVDCWPTDAVMHHIAIENNLSETAFAIQDDPTHYRLRWFAPDPDGEVDLCGHATLATAHVIFTTRLASAADQLTFATQSGNLVVTRRGDLYDMALPSFDMTPIPVTATMTAAFGATPREAFLGRDLVAVFSDDTTIVQMTPDLARVAELPGLLQSVTGPSTTTDHDCVSRTFMPKVCIDEDPVCGSAHCHIIPYWAQKLGKNELTAYQASQRTGVLYARYAGEITFLAGKAVTYATSTLTIPS